MISGTRAHWAAEKAATGRLAAAAARLCRDGRGVAALEFALIAPILMIMYFITMEASQAIETSKKVSRISSMVADLVTQQTTVDTAALDAIMKIADTTLQPYNRSEPTIVVTGISLSNDATPVASIQWSRKVENGTYMAGPANGETAVPDELKTPGTFLVRVSTSLGYTPFIAWAAGGQQTAGLTSAFNHIDMGETYYLRPRMTTSISCSDC